MSNHEPKWKAAHPYLPGCECEDCRTSRRTPSNQQDPLQRPNLGMVADDSHGGEVLGFDPEEVVAYWNQQDQDISRLTALVKEVFACVSLNELNDTDLKRMREIEKEEGLSHTEMIAHKIRDNQEGYENMVELVKGSEIERPREIQEEQIEETGEPATTPPADAVFGFAAWLTTREERTAFGETDNAGPAAEAAGEFCDANGWEVSIDYPGTYLLPTKSGG